MEIVILGGEIHEFPAFGDRAIAWSKRQTDCWPHWVERFYVNKRAGDGNIVLIDFFIAKPKSIRLIRWRVEKNPALMAFWQWLARRIAAECSIGGRMRPLAWILKQDGGKINSWPVICVWPRHKTICAENRFRSGRRRREQPLCISVGDPNLGACVGHHVQPGSAKRLDARAPFRGNTRAINRAADLVGSNLRNALCR